MDTTYAIPLEEKSEKRYVDYHLAQFENCYSSTRHLIQFTKKFLDSHGTFEGLDIGCGSGSNLFHLAKEFRNVTWTGVEYSNNLVRLGNEELSRRGISSKIHLQQGDLYSKELLSGKTFHFVSLIHVLLTLPEYEKAMTNLWRLVIPGGWFIINSTFSDFDVDLIINTNTYLNGIEAGPTPFFPYNIWCLGRFEWFCREKLKARKFNAEDFEIDIDLPRPTTRTFGTYTEKLQNGRRLQFTAGLQLPWKFIAIQK